MAPADISQQETKAYLARRTATSHAEFVLSRIPTNGIVVDCGCGPGTITLDLAQRFPGVSFLGIDSDPGMIAAARRQTATNLLFNEGSIYSMPLEKDTVDVVFSNAVFQHLELPLVALAEMQRVATVGGVVAIRVPDWSGLLMHPSSPKTKRAIERFLEIHYGPKKDPFIGCKLPSMLLDAGFKATDFSVSHEVNNASEMLSNISKRLRSAEIEQDAQVLEDAAQVSGAVFVQAWCQVVAEKQ